MEIAVYPHPTGHNRGCDAIAMTTAALLKTAFPDATRVLFATGNGSDEGVFAAYDEVRAYSLPRIKRFSPAWFAHNYAKWIEHRDQSLQCLLKAEGAAIRRAFADADLVLSIGGDNYCYGTPTAFYAVNHVLKGENKPAILWGCSLEPSAVDARMREDLCGYHAVFARETATYRLLQSLGASNAFCFPDPAFLLPATPVVLPAQFQSADVVGINISPLACLYESKKGIVMKNALFCIRQILANTPCSVALIPHVFAPKSNDLAFLRRLCSMAAGGNRVFVLGDMDCMSLKYAIGRCRFFIGARTHACIAAYTGRVPTLAVAYSAKAAAIAQDILGPDTPHILDIRKPLTEDALWNALCALMEREQAIRHALQARIPTMQEQAEESVAMLRRVVNGTHDG